MEHLTTDIITRLGDKNPWLNSVAENYGLGKVDLAGIAACDPDEPPQSVTVRVVPIRIRYA